MLGMELACMGAETDQQTRALGQGSWIFPSCAGWNHTFGFIEMSKLLYPCVEEAGLGGYKR